MAAAAARRCSDEAGGWILERRGDAMVSLQLEKKNSLQGNQPVIITIRISAIKQQSTGKSVGQEEEKDGIDRLCLLNDSLHRPDADRLITRTNHHVHVEFERIHPLIAKHERFLWKCSSPVFNNSRGFAVACPRSERQQQQSDAGLIDPQAQELSTMRTPLRKCHS